MRFPYPRIYHSIVVIVLYLEIYTNFPNELGDAVKIFLIPDLSPSSGSDTVLVTRWWEAILVGRTLKYFVDTIFLLEWNKVAPLSTWDKEVYQLESCSVFCAVFIIDVTDHPVTL